MPLKVTLGDMFLHQLTINEKSVKSEIREDYVDLDLDLESESDKRRLARKIFREG